MTVLPGFVTSIVIFVTSRTSGGATSTKPLGPGAN